MNKRIRFLVGASIAGLAAGGGAVAYSTGAPPTTATKSALPAPSTTVSRAVRVKEVRSESAASEQTYTGVIRARYETDLAFRVGAKIVSRHVEVGQRVSVGTLLFRLDATDYKLAVKAAEADLIAAEAEVVQSVAEHERQVRTYRNGVGSGSDLDKARSAQDAAAGRRDRAKESLTLARNRLSYCELIADADGVITTLPAETGQVVAEGQIVARLARDGEREAVVNLPENQAIAARTARASVTLWSAPGESFPAVLRELAPIADPVTRTYQARFTVQNPSPKVVLGMTATVHLSPSGAEPGYILPLSSLLRTGPKPAVWVVERSTGALTLVPVEVREYRHETVVLSGGVRSGQWVVTAGVQKLDVGVTVRAWEETP
ncbi:efflux RND transporter periplasmic adaptor subunit [Gemmata sp. G18]|uniref:Efflux RND transporter periplasmic adaptor subunit n=1 Tax=Gemmata palustris TaxID=2822762 RepID=A0ABS5BN09_9BACT|nr:efflux RND transporter periplasmic adaptor subunit [Gemmata palustris]MBP3955065.1 efflux RND transporter periplasmic adaptor subunit [Gemmata palustris]